MAIIEVRGHAEAHRRLGFMVESFRSADKRLITKAAILIRRSLREHAPVGQPSPDRHGKPLSESIGYRRIGNRVVFYGNQYVKWVIEGRGEVWAGIFTGKSDKKALHFFIGDQEIFTTHVGPQAANDFRKPALAAVTPELEVMIREDGLGMLRSEIASEWLGLSDMEIFQ